MKVDFDERKYCIVYIRGNNETIVGIFDNVDDARSKMQRIKQENKRRKGVYEMIRTFVLPNGKLDIFNRDSIDYYCPEAEDFLKHLLKELFV